MSKIIPLVSLLALLGPSFRSAAGVYGPPANVILVVSDNQAYRDVHCFGDPDVVTPNLDRLAAEGVKATSFYVMSGECTPSRGCILTGRYPQRNGLSDMIRDDMVDYKHRYSLNEYAVSPEMTLGLDLREITLGNLMKTGGYATGAVGKWDSGRSRRFLPLQRGFDSYYGFAVSGADYWSGARYGIPSTFRGNELETPHGFSEELFTQEALNFIQGSYRKPFFLYLAYHTPAGNASLDTKDRRVPKKYMDLYANRQLYDRRTGQPLPAGKTLSKAELDYLACISCMDDGIGQMMALLKKLGVERNTLFIFFSDNGWNRPTGDSGPFLSVGSQLDRLTEAGIRPPFIARWPAVLPAGATNDDMICALDIFPTLAAAAGVPIPANDVMDGFDLIPILQGKMPCPRTEIFFESQNGKAARVGNYKWDDIPNGRGKLGEWPGPNQPRFTGLFDLAKDPGESHDLSQEQPDILTFVKSRWDNWRREMDATEPRGPFRNY